MSGWMKFAAWVAATITIIAGVLTGGSTLRAQTTTDERPANASPPGATPAAAPAANNAGDQPGPTEAADEEAAYTRIITERADKIVAALELTDKEQERRVRDLVAQEYRSLREIHDALDLKVAETKAAPGADPTLMNAWVGVARAQANIKLLYLHRYFVSRLAAELTPEQVNQVKDGMTYGVVPITYDRYLKVLPQLTDEQKREIMANLVEARDYAMDAGSSEEKHEIFGKYKGRINNYLSAEGYNLKQAERELAAREKEERERRAAEQ